MKRNLHNFDRLIRVFVSAVCIYFGFIETSYVSQEILANLIGVLGIVNLFAAVFSYCPLYGITGLSTYKEKQNAANETQD